MPRADLRGMVLEAASSESACLCGVDGKMTWRQALSAVSLVEASQMFGRSVLIGDVSQFDAARSILALDGVLERMIVAPPELSGERLSMVIAQAGVDAIVSSGGVRNIAPGSRGRIDGMRPSGGGPGVSTEWILPTSGTTGTAKLVAHRLRTLLGAVRADGATPGVVWGTFYDIRRFGGLQIFLRAAVSGAPIVITESGEGLSQHVERLAELGVTHLSGTPSHWRRLLMSGEAGRISPGYIRLSGEIADQTLLDALSKAFPGAKIVHAYASTEAGVGFEVVDGREGFPASYLESCGGVEVKIVDGTLRLRSTRRAERYLGSQTTKIADGEGFVDTDDLVERVGDRVFFKGRRSGAINVGGLKVHPEEVEGIINCHQAVRMSVVKRRRSPILGDLIHAEVVLEKSFSESGKDAVRKEILSLCRNSLERHQVPVSVSFVTTLPLSPAGKVLRGEA